MIKGRHNFVDSMNEFDSKMSTKQRLGENDPFAHSFKQGDFAAVFFNKKWSRCLVLDVENQKAYVECVDNCKRDWIHLSKLEKLMPVFKVNILTNL